MIRKIMPIFCGMLAGIVLVGGMTSPAVLAKEKNTLDPKQYKVVAPGVLSRSGLPSDKQFVRLKNKGVVGVTNLLPANEPGGKGDVTRLPSFDTLGFRYLWLPIPGSFAPTDAQAKRFLSFVTNPKNQPVHIFCKAGNARTGTMVALYRYAVDGWAMDKAIRESKKFGGGPSKKQLAWLRGWAATHAPRAR